MSKQLKGPTPCRTATSRGASSPRLSALDSSRYTCVRLRLELATESAGRKQTIGTLRELELALAKEREATAAAVRRRDVAQVRGDSAGASAILWVEPDISSERFLYSPPRS